jgi:hypothetical protein
MEVIIPIIDDSVRIGLGGQRRTHWVRYLSFTRNIGIGAKNWSLVEKRSLVPVGKGLNELGLKVLLFSPGCATTRD